MQPRIAKRSAPPKSQYDRALELLKKHWGYDSFRPGQWEMIEPVLFGNDAVAVVFTGFGKSLLFQLTAMMMPGVTIVVSPLIALMKDQCDDLARRSIPATFVNSHVDAIDADTRLEGVARGRFKLLYIAPERIKSAQFIDRLKSMNVSLFAVDEAHMISLSSQSFRPAYKRISDIYAYFGANRVPFMDVRKLPAVRVARERTVPVLAVTATATDQIEKDIAAKLQLRDGYKRMIGDPIKPNLSYEVMCPKSPWEALKSLVRTTFDIREGRYIIYTSTRRGAEIITEIVGEVKGEGAVGCYHGGMRRDDVTEGDEIVKGRESVQDDFKSGRKPIVVATTAFGMGIDVPNIRLIAHFGVPGCVEDYVQAIGRAGRDGDPARAILMHDSTAVGVQKRFIDSENPPWDMYETLWAWMHEELKEPGDVLRSSAFNLCEYLKKQYPDFTPDAVTAILNTMEAYGLVKRTPSPGGQTIQLNPVETLEWARTTKPSASTLLADLLARLALKQVPAPVGTRVQALTQGRVEVVTDREALSQLSQKESSAIARSLNVLLASKRIVATPAYYGKTTEIEMRDATLSEHIPAEVIVAKRDLAYSRLQAMVGYVACRDKVQYIRDYFQRGTDVIRTLEA